MSGWQEKNKNQEAGAVEKSSPGYYYDDGGGSAGQASVAVVAAGAEVAASGACESVCVCNCDFAATVSFGTGTQTC